MENFILQNGQSSFDRVPWAVISYPARIWIQEAPPNSICADLLHPATAVKEHCEHALTQVDDLLVLLRVRRVGRVVCHGVFFGNRWDDERRVKSVERIAQGGELRVSPANLEILSTSSVNTI